ncbi:GNAT family N-acetyltransferase [uncultured Ruminococcus sp.]|uniref:GNAT family N-acetyltransferase n=1 Tax=uncultured Ruminococcus sp. TaxID=165186 RepID=UPI0025FBC29B|nr:GNAT family N-acetyltransferase [uncultured Ruminococcus sp.]
MSAFVKVPADKYAEYTAFAQAVPFGRVYPLSMTEGRQSGDIFTDGRAVLFWHYCGFAYISGEADDAFIDEVKKLMQNGERRLVLFADEKTAGYFGEGFDISRRLFFEYPEDKPAPALPPLPEGFDMRLMFGDIISHIEGRITPAFSWEDPANFISQGVGFCVTHSGKPCAWSFSAAVGGDETDIGVETDENFRRQGLSHAAAAMMTACVLEHGRKPVWACHEGNKASAGLAEKLGFVKTAECFTVHI